MLFNSGGFESHLRQLPKKQHTPFVSDVKEASAAGMFKSGSGFAQEIVFIM